MKKPARRLNRAICRKKANWRILSVLLQIIFKQQFAFKKHDYMFKAINVIMENVPFSSDYSKALSVARMMYSYGWICGIRSKRTGVRINAVVRAKV